MIEAEQLIGRARRQGYGWYLGVPCSFLTPFINYVIGDSKLNYLSSANEGDAVATAAGLWIGGERSVVMMQNSGLGNAVSPLSSLCHIFRIPHLLICTHRGAPGVKDEPQHALMGRITGELFDLLGISWEPFPTIAEALDGALARADAHMQRERRPYALLMEKSSVAPHPLKQQATSRPNTLPPRRQRFPSSAKRRPSRAQALERLTNLTGDAKTVVIATTGYTGRELFALADRPNQLYMVGSMGCASSLGLGLALARPDLRVVVVDGDGAALMRMGNFATVGAYGHANLVHLLLDNEAHESTGGQPTVSSSVQFGGIARACGYATVLEGDDLNLVDALLAVTEEAVPGPRFGHLKIRPGSLERLPRPDLTPGQVLNRLMAHIGSPMG